MSIHLALAENPSKAQACTATCDYVRKKQESVSDDDNC
jgi:hypothetical protein